MRAVARGALDEYGLGRARLELLRQAGNTLFRVVDEDAPRARVRDDLFSEGRYLLRVHHAGYQTAGAVALEMEWLAALRRDAGVAVPEPVPTLDGRLTAEVEAPGVPGKRNCSLLRWLTGRLVRKRIRPDHFRAQGRLMARLHDHAARWRPAVPRIKRCYDYDGLFRGDGGAGLPAARAWPLLPGSCRESFQVVARRVKQVMDAWGTGPEAYGLIHGDLGVDANVLFWGGEARAIDFDESGFGYWVYDLAVSLEHCQDDAAFPAFRDALLGGYAEVRSLPEEQLSRLELFMAAFHVYWSLWAVATAHRFPESGEKLRGRIDRAATLVRRYALEHWRGDAR
jgi:Ser/Thr protein kinase RdoA (MazF antagonist)